MTFASVPSLVADPSVSSRTNRIQRVHASCGVEAWLVEDYTVPLLALEFAFRGGYAQDAEGGAGSAVLLAGLLEEGAGALDSQQFQARVEELALDMSFHAQKDSFGGNMRSLIKHRDAAFEMLRLAICEPRLDEDAIQRVKAQTVAGMKHEENDPNAIAAKAWNAKVFAGHPYGLPDRGSYQSLESIGRADLLALKDRVFARSALKIAVVGAISAETLAGLIDKTFGALPELARLTPVGLIEPQGVGSKDVILLDVPQSVIRFGTSGPRRNSPDYMPAFVVNHILGGGVFSARLFKEVREKRGLAYSVHSSLVCFDATGLLVGGTATKNERAGESLGVIEEQIALMAESGPTAEELALAKKYLTGSYALRFDTSTKIAGQLVQIQLDDLGIDYIDRRNIEVNEVTLARACEAAADLFGRSKLAVTVVGQPQGL